MSEQNQAQIIIIDNDPQVGDDLRELLEPSGYRVDVILCDASTPEEEIIQAARQFRPHVAVVDLRLLDDQLVAYTGLELLHRLQSAHCILYSAYLTVDTIRDGRKFLYDWMKKHDEPQKLRNAIHRAAAEKAASRSPTHVTWPEGFDRQARVAPIADPALPLPPATVLDDVVVQLYPGRRQVHLRTLNTAAHSPSSVARMRSAVLLAQADELEPTVLKFARTRQIEKEEKNYRDHIDGRRPGAFSTRLVNQTKFWDIGGAVYTFMGAADQALPTFAYFYRTTPNPDEILRPLHFFFTELWGPYYQTTQRPLSGSLFEAYDQVFNLQVEEQNLNNLFRALLQSGLTSNPHNPVAWAFGNAEQSRLAGAQEAITHGDLHGDNLFVDEPRTWVIDFERTGYGHVLRDFAELEVDILVRLMAYDQVDDATFDMLAKALYSSLFENAPANAPESVFAQAEAHKAYRVITGLRTLARNVAQFSDLREYYWGVLLDALFVASIGQSHPEQQRRAMLLSTIVCDVLK